MKQSRWIAIILIAFILGNTVYSIEFLMKNTHHTCMNQHCIVCFEMDQAVQVLSGIKINPILTFLMSVLSGIILSSMVINHLYKKCDTLISLKVEMLN